MGNSKDEVIKYMKLQSDLRKLVERWERFDSNREKHPTASWGYAKGILKERTASVKKLLKEG